MVDIFRAAKQRSGYPLHLPTLRWIIIFDTETIKKSFIVVNIPKNDWKSNCWRAILSLRLLGGELYSPLNHFWNSIEREKYYSPSWYIWTINSLSLVRKYARIFLCGLNLFQDAFCELRGTDNDQGQIYQHIFAPDGGHRINYPSNIFSAREKCLRTVNRVQREMYTFSVFSGTILWTKKTCSFFCHNHTTRSHLEFNLKRRIFRIGRGIWKLGNITRVISLISPSFSQGIFSNAMRFEPK